MPVLLHYHASSIETYNELVHLRRMFSSAGAIQTLKIMHLKSKSGLTPVSPCKTADCGEHSMHYDQAMVIKSFRPSLLHLAWMHAKFDSNT